MNQPAAFVKGSSMVGNTQGLLDTISNLAAIQYKTSPGYDENTGHHVLYTSRAKLFTFFSTRRTAG
jgi:hypothetical protein